MKFTCIIIDDEPAGRQLIEKHITSHPDYKLLKSFEDAGSAIEFVKREAPDLILSDIDMPKISGLEIPDILDNDCPLIIYITGNPRYLQIAKGDKIIDSLLKPLSFEVLSKSLEKSTKRLKQLK